LGGMVGNTDPRESQSLLNQMMNGVASRSPPNLGLSNNTMRTQPLILFDVAKREIYSLSNGLKSVGRRLRTQFKLGLYVLQRVPTRTHESPAMEGPFQSLH
jgi:hypothetical protein